MSLDALCNYALNAVRDEERKRWENNKDTVLQLGMFFVERQAGKLVGKCKKNAEHHREREKFYIKELEIAERDLRENGINIELHNSQKGYSIDSIVRGIASGAVTSGSIGSYYQSFQPKIDPEKLDRVKATQGKMLEHRDKAVQFERYGRAFSLDKERLLKLSVTEVDYFRLEEGD